MEIIRNSRGAILAFVAVLLFLFLTFIGLATDAGWTVYVRSQGQARVDAAALAAASALVSQSAATRQTDATARANTFSGKNTVVNSSVNPANVLQPMFYNFATHTLASAIDWQPKNANAVRVTNTVPTPLFFSRVREVFGGASETCTNTDGSSGQNCTNVTVRAAGYLGCPGACDPSTCGSEVPLALCGNYVGYPNKCGQANALQVPNTTNNSAFTTFFSGANDNNCKNFVNNPNTIPPVGVGDVININNGQLTSCLSAIKTQYNTKKDASGKWCVLTAVMNCPGGPLTGSASVVGFAEMCITTVVDQGTPKYVQGFLKCDVGTNHAKSGGACFGVSATNPILVSE